MTGKQLIVRVLIVAGIVYVIALIPASIRPAWSKAPFRKPNQTITVLVDNPAGQPSGDLHQRLRDACRSPWPFRPLMGSAHAVRVIFTYHGRPVRVHQYECELYV